MSRLTHCTALALAMCLALLVGCSPAEPDATTIEGVNPDPSLGPGMWTTPADPDLSSPTAAVGTYLEWITFAYRLADSNVATQTFTPWQEVRVDSYIQLNTQENRAIEQHLDVFELRDSITAEPTATVAAYEEWTYRYFTIDTIEWIGEENRATYETTYTVVLQSDGRWLVADVDAEPLTELK